MIRLRFKVELHPQGDRSAFGVFDECVDRLAAHDGHNSNVLIRGFGLRFLQINGQGLQPLKEPIYTQDDSLSDTSDPNL